jgi:AraC-like DNA-binding protein
MSELCGPQWRPLRVQFAHRPPDSPAAHRRHFRADVAFDAEVCGLVFASTWLERTIAGADATRREFLARTIRAAQAHAPLSVAEQVQHVLPQLVLSGLPSAGAVARMFAIHERTLRRRLEREGASLQLLIRRTRFDLARQLLQNTDLTVTAIATALHYDDPNALSRAFRSWASLSPRQWRARAGARDPLC